MKKIISIISLSVLLLIGVTGCSEWLNVKPESEIILDDYWKSESDVEAVLASCYRSLTEDGVIYRMIVWGELRSDNLIVGGGIHNDRRDIAKILQGEILSTNSFCSWAAFYSSINYCNTLLKYAPIVLDRDENFTEADLNKVRAEALTLRALSYFYLVRTFKEVPWVTNASIDDTQDYTKAKSSERALLDSIISNLKEAKRYARVDYGNNDFNKGRVTLNTINSILADVYLWDNQYQNCVSACNEVIADPKLKLVPAETAFTRVFYLGNSTESIFEIPQFNNEDITKRPLHVLYGSAYDNTGELGFPATLAYDAQKDEAGLYSPFVYKVSVTLTESPKDFRAKDSYILYGGQNFMFKYAGVSRYESLVNLNTSTYRYRYDISNWILYRLSDIMLMKAEALVQLDGESNFKDAMKMINKTYLRSNLLQDSLQVANYNSKSEMEKLVLRERHRELLFEGKRWYDLVRFARREGSTSTLNDFVNHKNTGNSASLGATVLDAMYMPILQSELEANKKLEQNEYYKESATSSTR